MNGGARREGRGGAGRIAQTGIRRLYKKKVKRSVSSGGAKKTEDHMPQS